MRTTISILALVALAACGESGGTGRLAVQLTDGPFPATAGCLDKALVAVEAVEVNDGSGFVLVPFIQDAPAPVTMDLLQLRSGIAADLAVGDLPTGQYGQIRIVISGATLVFADGTSKEFKVPSGDTSGIKINPAPALLIAANQTTPLLLDLDLSSSFHVTGQGGAPACDDLKDAKGKVIFRPTIKALNPDLSGVVSGLVKDAGGAALADVEITAFAAGAVVDGASEPVASTFSAPAGLANAAPGSYAMHLDAGTYDLYARPQGDDARVKVLSGLKIAEGQLLTGQDVTVQ